MYLPFSHLPKSPLLANFETFRKSLSHLFTLLSRLTSGKTYLDTSSVQSCVTPLVINSNITVRPTAALESKDQVANHPRPVTVSAWSGFGLVSTATPHTFVVGMPVKYKGVVYYVKSVFTDTLLLLWKKYDEAGWGLIGDPLPGDILSFAYPMTQIKEDFFLARNNTYPVGIGSLAYGDIVDTGLERKSNFYYNTGDGFKQTKLGLDLGNSYYNANKTKLNAYTGWCHGMGNYKIVASANQIEIVFDYIQVREVNTELRSIVPVVGNQSNDYDLIIQNTVGLGGIDAGIVSANKGYYIYFVYNRRKDTYGAMISLNPDRPDPFPIDAEGNRFDSFQRLGWVQTDANASFLPSIQVNDRMTHLAVPSATATLGFNGTGTSANIPVITEGFGFSSRYPYNYYLKAIDIQIRPSGTSVNTSDVRQVYLDGKQIYAFSNANLAPSSVIPNGIIGYPSIGTNMDMNIIHPSGTYFTSLNLHLTGFIFDKGTLHI